MISGNSKGVKKDMYGLAPLQVQERAVIDTVLIWLPRRTCIVKILISRKYLCQTFERKDFEIFLVGQAVLQMSQISRSCVIELLNVFEDSAQHVHAIEHVIKNFGHVYIICLLVVLVLVLVIDHPVQVITAGYRWEVLHISCNGAFRLLHDLYSLCPWACSPWAVGHTYPAKPSCLCFNYYMNDGRQHI